MSQIDLQWFAEQEDKTEEPTEHRLNEARKEGRVPKSQDLNGAIVSLLTTALLVALGPWMLEKFQEMMVFFFQNINEPHVDSRRFAIAFARYFLILAMPFSVTGLIAGVVANILQNRGFIFSLKPIQPKLSKIVPHFLKYLKNTIFSKKGVFNILKSLLKVGIIVVIAFLVIRNSLPKTLNYLHSAGPRSALKQEGAIIVLLMLLACFALLMFGIVDFVMQRRFFIDEMKMTKQEVKEEFKEMEGDPQVKGHLENARREMLRQNMPKAVREADVLITNPTHFAVALQWKQGVSDAPMVTAKGEDMTAQNMKRIARDADVPTVENRPLARALYTETEVGDIIPQAYLRVIAEVYAHIGYMDKQKRKEAESSEKETQTAENAS